MNRRQPVKVIEQDSQALEIRPEKVYHYLGLGHSIPNSQLQALIDRSIVEYRKAAQFRACFRIVSCSPMEGGTDLEVFPAPGKDLAKNLSGCNQAILFAATTGLKAERQRKRKEIVSPAESLAFDAVGTTAVESFCDALCNTWRNEFSQNVLRPRFSPGYGDLPLETQAPLLESLDAKQQIGISLTAAYLMVPQKSVSAIVGIGKTGCVQKEQSCQICSKINCEFRL